jgi:ATP-dependent Zn protease
MLCQYKRANTDAAPAGAGRYAKVGARVPAGVLLCGPPGTLCSTKVQIPALLVQKYKYWREVGARVPSGVLLCGPLGAQFTCFTSTQKCTY